MFVALDQVLEYKERWHPPSIFGHSSDGTMEVFTAPAREHIVDHPPQRCASYPECDSGLARWWQRAVIDIQ